MKLGTKDYRSNYDHKQHKFEVHKKKVQKRRSMPCRQGR